VNPLSGRRAAEHVLRPKSRPPRTVIIWRRFSHVLLRGRRAVLRTTERTNDWVHPDRAATTFGRVQSEQCRTYARVLSVLSGTIVPNASVINKYRDEPNDEQSGLFRRRLPRARRRQRDTNRKCRFRYRRDTKRNVAERGAIAVNTDLLVEQRIRTFAVYALRF